MICRTTLSKFFPFHFSLPSPMSITIYVCTHTHATQQHAIMSTCSPASSKFFFSYLFTIDHHLCPHTIICTVTPTSISTQHPHPTSPTFSTIWSSTHQHVHMPCTCTITWTHHTYAHHCIHLPCTHMKTHLLAISLYLGIEEVELE